MRYFSAPDDDPDESQVEDDLTQYEKDAQAKNQDHDPSWDGGDNDQ
ncbi:MAG: hypothetical protein WAS94_03530 [Candidatus Saccharimonadales bacterium]